MGAIYWNIVLHIIIIIIITIIVFSIMIYIMINYWKLLKLKFIEYDWTMMFDATHNTGRLSELLQA